MLHVDGTTYPTSPLQNTVEFYDEKALKPVTNHTLTKRYGVDPLETDLRKFGIYPLTEQPNYSVAAYVKEGEEYTPIRSYEGELNRANARVAELQTSFEARIAALEADHEEMMDDDNKRRILMAIQFPPINSGDLEPQDGDTYFYVITQQEFVCKRSSPFETPQWSEKGVINPTSFGYRGAIEILKPAPTDANKGNIYSVIDGGIANNTFEGLALQEVPQWSLIIFC